MTLLIFLLLGLIVGSFLNVLVYRIHMAEDVIWDRSKCPRCEHLIRWYDNIPILSFILLGARCRDCREKISWQYPLVELFTALMFLAIGAKFFDPADSATWLVAVYYLGIISALIVILVYDWSYMEIPSSILWTAIFGAIAFNLYFDWLNFYNFPGAESLFDFKLYSGAVAGILAFIFFFSLSAISREKWMGMGDAYLALLLGLVLGWPEIILAIFLAFFIGAVSGSILMIFGRKNLKSQIPFAPFLIAGTIISLFFYFPIAEWYWNLLA